MAITCVNVRSLTSLNYSLEVLTYINFMGCLGGGLFCIIETGSHYVTLAKLVLIKYGQANLKLTVILLSQPLECWYLKHAPQPVFCSVCFCSVCCHNLQRRQRTGPRGSSGRGCP